MVIKQEPGVQKNVMIYSEMKIPGGILAVILLMTVKFVNYNHGHKYI